MAYTPKQRAKIQAEICDRIASGESLRGICEKDSARLPDRITILKWLSKDSAFATEFARARELQADYLEEEMADIERDALRGHVDSKAASVVLNSKRWRAEKLKPRVYGVKQQVDLHVDTADELQAALRRSGKR